MHFPAWAGYVLALLSTLASWRWIVKPLRKIGKEAMAILREIRDSARERRDLALTQHELAGAMVQLGVTMAESQREVKRQVANNTERLDGLAEEVVDLSRDVRHLKQAVERSPRK